MYMLCTLKNQSTQTGLGLPAFTCQNRHAHSCGHSLPAESLFYAPSWQSLSYLVLSLHVGMGFQHFSDELASIR